MIQCSAISKAYGRQVIFESTGFTLCAGERVGLIGRNGSGKTTLLRMITGDEHPDEGEIFIPNGYRIGYLSQRLGFTEASVIGEACRSFRERDDDRDMTYKAETVLLGLGFPAADFALRPSALSGGFQVRLHLAKTLLGEPNLLLLDEPTNYLDIVSLRWLSGFLRSWRGELVLVTHDRAFMDGVTTHTMGIHRCTIRKMEGTTEKFTEQILMEEEMHEKTRINDEKRIREIEQFITRFRAQATRARAVQSKIKGLMKREKLEKLTDPATLDFSFRNLPFRGRCLIDARSVSFSFGNGGTPLIGNMSITIGKDDRIGVIGKNGKGKTTLLNLLSGELEPQQGTIDRHPNIRIAHFGQTNVERLSPSKTVEEEIASCDANLDRTTVRGICGAMLFEGDDALKKVSVLSGGERSRVLLGRMLASPANILLLDEPTNHLDIESVDALLAALDSFEGAIVIVTHSEMILNALTGRLIVFDLGETRVFEGTYRDFLERRGWSDEIAPESGTMLLNGERESRGQNRRELRRRRAELIDERAKALGELGRSISSVEETITRLEEDIKRNTAALVRASETGDWQTTASCSKAVHEAKERIDTLFLELEDLTDRHTAQSRKFDEKLAALPPG